MKLSTRNQLPASVGSVTTGEAMAVVKLHLEGGQPITASITKEAAVARRQPPATGGASRHRDGRRPAGR